MKKQFRLRQTRDFQRLRKIGKVYRHPLFLVSLAPNQLSYNRYGFVTARHLGNAVKRNRIRRLLRESVRLLHPHLNQGNDIVIVVRAPIVGRPFADIKAAVEEAFRKATIVDGLRKT